MHSYVVWIGSEQANCSMYQVFRAPSDEDAQRFATAAVSAHDADMSEAAGEEVEDSKVFEFIRLGSPERESENFSGGSSADWEVREEGAARLEWLQLRGDHAAEVVSTDGWGNG